MNLLLILSAILSALAGVGGVSRAPQASASIARVAQGAAVTSVRKAVTDRPQQALPALEALSRDSVRSVFAPVPAEPPYGARRRQ